MAAPIAYVSELTTVAGYVSFGWVTPSAYFALFYVSILWVATFVILFIYAGYGFFYNSFPLLWPLRALRSVGTISAAYAFIPLFYLILSVFTCGLDEDVNFWDGAGYTCYAGGHLVLAIIAAALAVSFLTLAALFTSAVFDSNSLSMSLSAKAHGRADLLLLLTKSALVVVAEVFPHSLGQWTVVAFVCAGAVVWVGTYAFMLPMLDHRANRLQLALASMFAWAAACTVLGVAQISFVSAVTVSVCVCVIGALYIMPARAPSRQETGVTGGYRARTTDTTDAPRASCLEYR